MQSKIIFAFLMNGWSNWCETKSNLDTMLTRVPLTLTFDLDFWPLTCISEIGLPIVMERKGRESIGCPDVKHFDFWPWIFKVKLYLANGRPDCHGTKGTGVDRMPWCETLRKWVNWTLQWLGYIWPRHLTLNFHGQIVSWEWEDRLSWNARDGSQ